MTFDPFIARCDRCGEPIRNLEDCWSSISGWARPRAAGGPDRRLLRPTGKYMCNGCMDLLEDGLTPGQGSLLA